MEILEKLKKLDDKELNDFIEERIAFLEEESIKYNPSVDTIGFKLDYNPTNYHLLDNEDVKSFEITVRCFYSGYIPKGIKMVYGMEYHNGRIASNNGNYYYVDDDQYIYDFCKLIKDKEVVDQFELFEYIFEFCRHYFGSIKRTLERDEMHKLILEKENYYFKPKEEHVFSSFKEKGNAMCTEYSLMAQNIMSFLGIESYFVIGKEEDIINGVENHAFNFVHFEKDGDNYYLIDYSSPVKIYNEKFEEIDKSPFMGKLEELNQEFVNDLLTNDTHLLFKSYAYCIFGDTLLKLEGSILRQYYVDSKLHSKEKINS